jgi:hypothetical protein
MAIHLISNVLCVNYCVMNLKDKICPRPMGNIGVHGVKTATNRNNQSLAEADTTLIYEWELHARP